VPKKVADFGEKRKGRGPTEYLPVGSRVGCRPPEEGRKKKKVVADE